MFLGDAFEKVSHGEDSDRCGNSCGDLLGDFWWILVVCLIVCLGRRVCLLCLMCLFLPLTLWL